MFRKMRSTQTCSSSEIESRRWRESSCYLHGKVSLLLSEHKDVKVCQSRGNLTKIWQFYFQPWWKLVVLQKDWWALGVTAKLRLVGLTKPSTTKSTSWTRTWTLLLSNFTPAGTETSSFCLQASARSFQIWKNYGLCCADWLFFATTTSIIKYLFLFDNKIATIEPNAFADLVNVQRLELEHNVIKKLDGPLVFPMVKLASFVLSRDQVPEQRESNDYDYFFSRQ